MTVWGTGTPRREFLHVDDLADACRFLMERYDGEEIGIRELAELVREAVGFEGEIVFDTGKPDGTPRKLLDVGKLRALGWQPTIPPPEGIRRTVEFYSSVVVPL